MDKANHRVQVDALVAAAIIGVVLFAVLVALIPLVKEGYSPVENAISDAARGPYGYLQTIAFFALGLGSLALATGLWQRLDGRAARNGSALIGLWGLGAVTAGIFPLTEDPETTTATIHNLSSLLAFVAAVVGMFILSTGFRSRRAWQSFWPTSSVLALGAFIAFMVTGATEDSDWWGVPQRVFVGLVLLWLLLTALRLRAVGRATT